MGKDVLEAVKQRGLAGANRPNGDLQALAAHHSFHHGAERVTVRLRKMKEPWVWRQPKRILF
jgi:hypothetical protein